jgi:hypothetical protein
MMTADALQYADIYVTPDAFAQTDVVAHGDWLTQPIRTQSAQMCAAPLSNTCDNRN